MDTDKEENGLVGRGGEGLGLLLFGDRERGYSVGEDCPH
jgi:hypothetical protein